MTNERDQRDLIEALTNHDISEVEKQVAIMAAGIDLAVESAKQFAASDPERAERILHILQKMLPEWERVNKALDTLRAAGSN